MKCKMKPIGRIWLLLSIAVGLAVILPMATHANTATTATGVEYYGRYALSLEPDADIMLYVYDQLAMGIENSEEEISIYDGSSAVSADMLSTVFDAYTRDHPEHFWLGTSYHYYYNSSTILSVQPSYLFSGNQLKTAKAAYEKAVDQLLAGIDDSMTDFQIELLLHDRLARSVVYAEAANAHNSYGALVEGKAVCEGYAEAFQYLLQRAGIQSFIAIGAGINPTTNSAEPHAWNYVRIDGKYYQTDLTWNDQGNTIYHAYFNLSDDVMTEDHAIATVDYQLPICNSEAAQYFSVMGGTLPTTSYSADFVGQRLKNDGLRTNVYITGSINGFINWMEKNISAIAKTAGVKGGFKYSYQYLGRELFLTVSPNCEHTSLTYVRSQSATCTSDGNLAYYICDCEKRFFDSDAIDEIVDLNQIIIPAKGHDYTEKINDKAHLRTSATDCRSYDTYWYDCSRCAVNAKNDSTAAGKYYNGAQRGEHLYTEKIADSKHLVTGSGSDCKHAKQYYYDCAYCDGISSTVWTSDSYGAHQLSKQWNSDGNSHFHKCTVSGCTHRADLSACAGGTATCMKKAECRTCHNEYGSFAAHQFANEWSVSAQSHWRECECSERSKLASHADGNRDGKCDTCRYAMGAPTDSATTAPLSTSPDATETADSPSEPPSPGETTLPITPSTTTAGADAPQKSVTTKDGDDTPKDSSDSEGVVIAMVAIAALIGISATVLVAIILTVKAKKSR